jgi:phosphopantetheinyl transferase
MIHWLVQTTKEIPELKRGLSLDRLLNAREQERLAALKTEKRRHDWLLGRWTSKLLVQAVLRQEEGEVPPLNDLIISNDPSGAPFVTGELTDKHLPVTISISHSGDRAFCAATGIASGTQIPMGVLGADIEQVESRPQGFVQDYFSETEVALVHRTPSRCRDLLVTATWSAKEAALKAVHLGLTVDTRSVTCLIEPVADPPNFWTPFPIRWEVWRLNRYSPAPPELPQLMGWWRIQDGYVLSLAAQRPLSPKEAPTLSFGRT